MWRREGVERRRLPEWTRSSEWREFLQRTWKSWDEGWGVGPMKLGLVEGLDAHTNFGFIVLPLLELDF